MSRYSVNMDNAQEAEIVPANNYNLEINHIELKRTKNDTRDMIYARLLVLDAPRGVDFPEVINHWMVLPNDDENNSSDESVKDMARRWNVDVARFVTVFGGDPSDFDTDDLLGAKAECYVGVGKDQNGNDCNTINPPKPKNSSE